MRKKLIVMLTVVCLLCSFTACGGGPNTTNSVGVTAPPASSTDSAPPVRYPTFAAMPQKTQDIANVYRLNDAVVLFSFITPGMEAGELLVVMAEAADTIDLGEEISFACYACIE